MDETSVEFMDELDHLDYPRQSVGAELDILDLDQMIAQFASQHTHPTARRPDDQAFHVRLFPKTGRGEKCTLEYGELISYFRNNFRTLNEKTLRFFFMVQPGGWNRIWMPCMQILLSIFNVNPSFAWLVGKRHVSSFGSYVRMVDKGDDEKADKKDDKTGGEESEKNGHNRYGEKVPRIYETWWSLSSPKFFRSGLGTLAINSLDEGQRRLFDVESYDVQSVESNRLATMMWRPSVCVQYDLERKSSTVIVLDEGPSFLDSRFKDAMLHREQLGFNEDPFAIHVLILSVVLNDWTFSFEAMQLVINEKQSRVFGNQTRRDEYEQISKSLHDLIAHQLRYQNSITAIPRVLEALRRAHHRFTELEDVPGHVFQRVEDLLERMILQAHSNRDHCMRMEQQINNIQRQLIDLTNLEMESQIRRNTQTVNDLVRRLDAEQAQRVRQAVPGTRVGPETLAVPTGGIGPALPAVETENFPAILEMVNFGREQSIILKEQAEALVQFARGAEAQSKLLKNVAITTVLFLIPTALTSTFSMEVFNFPGPGEKGDVTVSPKALILVLTASACFLGALVFAVWTMGLPVIKPYLLKPTPWAISEVERTLSWIWRGKPPGDSQNDENGTTSIEAHELQRISNNSQSSTHSDQTPPSTNTNNAPREQNRTSGTNPGASPMQLAPPPRAYLSPNASPLSPPRSQGGDSGERERAGSSGSRSSGSREVEPYVTGNGDGAAVAPAVQARLLRRNLVAEYND